jgi:hypothetical protein
MKRRLGEKRPRFPSRNGVILLFPTAPPFFAMGPRNGSENKELNMKPISEMSILKKEKEFK